MSDAGVVRTHQDAARWYFQFGENCAGNVARVHITGVGNYAAERGGRRLAWREIGLDVREQSFGIAWIEAARNGGVAGGLLHRETLVKMNSLSRTRFGSGQGRAPFYRQMLY